MLSIISTHITLLPHYPAERISVSSLGFELVNWLIMILLFWVVQCAHVPAKTYRLLSCGLTLWILWARPPTSWMSCSPSRSGSPSTPRICCDPEHHTTSLHINSQLRQQALFDDLSRLPNRRYFHQQLFLGQE